MKPSRTFLATGALVLAMIARSPGASAQTNEARVAFQAGVSAYASQHYAEALEAFRNAYRIRPHPSVLVNIANCYVALNRPQDAISTFERFLNDPTVTPSLQQRNEIEAALAEARRHLATISVLVFPPGAEVYLDGDLVGTAPLRRPLQTGPGPHVIEARQPGGGTVQHQARVEGGGTITLTLDIARNRSYVGSVAPEAQPPAPVVVAPAPVVVAPTPAVVVPTPRPVVVVPAPVVVAPVPVVRVAPPVAVLPVTRPNPALLLPPPRDTERHTRGIGAAFWTGLTLTVAAAGTSVGFFVYAASLEEDYNNIVTLFQAQTDPVQQSYYRALGLSYADAVDQNRLVAYVMAGVAGGAALFTIGAAVFGATTAPDPQRASLRILPNLRGNGLTLSGTF